MIAAGRRDKRVTFLREPTGRTATGGRPKGPWTALGTHWAHVRQLDAAEVFAAGGYQSGATMTVNLRWRVAQSYTEGDRIRYRGEDHEVIAIRDVDQRRRELEFVCKRVRPGS